MMEETLIPCAMLLFNSCFCFRFCAVTTTSTIVKTTDIAVTRTIMEILIICERLFFVVITFFGSSGGVVAS